ncbi:hypothetical protein GH733_016555 [Mirounga leonina]|nr:hypothetical protein GH733_016555 [Mirounga leonina]
METEISGLWGSVREMQRGRTGTRVPRKGVLGCGQFANIYRACPIPVTQLILGQLPHKGRDFPGPQRRSGDESLTICSVVNGSGEDLCFLLLWKRL